MLPLSKKRKRTDHEKVKCKHCNGEFNKDNIAQHVKTKHRGKLLLRPHEQPITTFFPQLREVPEDVVNEKVPKPAVPESVSTESITQQHISKSESESNLFDDKTENESSAPEAPENVDVGKVEIAEENIYRIAESEVVKQEYKIEQIVSPR